MNRLTEKDSIDNKRYFLNKEENIIGVTNKRLDNCVSVAYCWGKPIDKLAQLEDIMEKYDIADLEQYLLKMRKVDKELRDTIQQLHTIIDTIGYDRDTWQDACKLMGETIQNVYPEPFYRFTDNIPQYFYHLAKNKGEEDDKK